MAGAESVSSSEAKEKWEKHSTGHGSAFSPFCLSIYGCSGSSVLHIVVTCGLPIVVASLVAEHGLSSWGTWACGIFPDQGWNLCPLHWQADLFFFFLIIIF